jgi:hypothetical protein
LERLYTSKRNEAIAVLLGHTEKTQSMLLRIGRKYDEFLGTDFKVLGPKNTSAIIHSGTDG